MDYAELRKIFHEQVYPAQPNEWDIEDALYDLEDLNEEQQRLLLQAVSTVWPISHSLSFSFLKEGTRHAGELDSETLAEWLRRILFNYEEGGLKKARAYMAESHPDLLLEEVEPAVVRLSENIGRLTAYARGISGLDIKLQSSGLIYTDTETIYLPEEVDFFINSNKNLLYYKLIISQQTSCIVQGSLGHSQLFQLWRSAPQRPEEKINGSPGAIFSFEKFDDRQCAAELYQLMELYRSFQLLNREFPGLIRETAHIRRQLLHLRKVNQWSRKTILEDLLRAIVLPDDNCISPESTLLSLLHSPRQGPEILKRMYEYVTEREKNRAPFNFYPFMDTFNFSEVRKVTEKRIEKNKKEFETLLADFLIKSEQISLDRLEVDTAVEQGDSARLQLAEGGSDDIGSGASITIDNKSIELPEEIQELISRIQADLGKMPDGYVSAAFGIAGQGRPAGEGEMEEIVEESVERFIPYDEWDYRRHGYRKNWCSLRQRTLTGVKSDFVERTLVKHKKVLLKIRRQFEMMRTQERFARRRRYGDDLDLDALVESMGDQSAGLPPSEKVFIRLIRNQRSISTNFLVDMSNSTEGWIGIAIKEALVLLCEAMETVGDRYGIFGFSGMRRMRSEVYKIKDIAEPYSRIVKERIAAIGPKEYTRMGPPIRHMIKHFADIEGKSRLLLIISDGKPEDYDDYKGQYAIEDTRKALAEARGQGIHPYCITIDQESHDYLEHLFGRGNYTYVNNIEQLPSRLTEIYRLLTR